MIEHDLDQDVHDPARWSLLCDLLAQPCCESRRLAALLQAWPAEIRMHVCRDDRLSTTEEKR